LKNRKFDDAVDVVVAGVKKRARASVAVVFIGFVSFAEQHRMRTFQMGASARGTGESRAGRRRMEKIKLKNEGTKE
jgi:hypothetical protein